MNCITHLERMLDQADSIDVREGKLAYSRYHAVMCELSRRYSMELEKVIAVFVSLSPNSDYYGNLRSTVSVLAGIFHNVPEDQVTISTYKHCRDRAFLYGKGKRVFLQETKGPKITNFYHNVLDPSDTRWVTIDGHMSAIWRNQNLTMREALVKGRREYNEIADAVKKIAFYNHLIPNQLQAILWFTRKRLFKVKFEPQGGLFEYADNDVWKTSVDVSTLTPYVYRGNDDQGNQTADMAGNAQGPSHSKVPDRPWAGSGLDVGLLHFREQGDLDFL